MEKELGKDLIIKEVHRDALLDLIDKLNGMTFRQKEPYIYLLRSLMPLNSTVEKS